MSENAIEIEIIHPNHQPQYHAPVNRSQESKHDVQKHEIIKTSDENFSPHLIAENVVDSLLSNSPLIRTNENSDQENQPTNGHPRQQLPPLKLKPAHKIKLSNAVNLLSKIDNVMSNRHATKPGVASVGNGVGLLTFNSYFKDDWSKESCNEFLNPLESFLDNQLKRERSSRRRCKELVKLRNMENNRTYVENTIKELDEKISLNVLLKKNRSLYTKSKQSNANGGSSNYRALIADEIIKRNSYCYRCVDRNRRVEDNQLNDSMGLSRSRLNNRSVTKTPFKLPSLIGTNRSALLNSSEFVDGPESNNDLFLPTHSQLGVRTPANMSNITSSSLRHMNEHSSNNHLLVSAEFNLNKTSVINKHPIEIKRKNVV